MTVGVSMTVSWPQAAQNGPLTAALQFGQSLGNAWVDMGDARDARIGLGARLAAAREADTFYPVLSIQGGCCEQR